VPRPPPKTGSASWDAQHHRLSDDAREKLIDALGLDPTVNPDEVEPANQALAEVEKWLGSYSGAEIAIANAPKASDFVRSLSSIENDTIKLLRTLEGVHQWVRDEFARTDIDFRVLYEELETLRDTSLSIKGKYEDVESRGAPKKEALRHVILCLREIFTRYYRGPIQARREVGAVQSLSEYESAEEEFITVALSDAKIPYGENLRRLLDEPNMTVQSDMRDRIDRDTDDRWAEVIKRNSLEIKEK